MIKVGILFGGPSFEHEISLLSAQNVVRALDHEKYTPVLIGISKQGHWLQYESLSEALLNPDSAEQIGLNLETAQSIYPQQILPELEVVFPVLHGINVEDGAIQGLLRLAGVPFVGCDVLSSAIAMDKDVSKRLLAHAGIAVPDWLVYQRWQRNDIEYKNIVAQLGSPFFIKPANTGSSVGISKVKTEADFAAALDNAFEFDCKIVCENFIAGREIECAVLGNNKPRASVLGEIITTHEFYSYEAKYLDTDATQTVLVTDLEPTVVSDIQNTAIKAFQALECTGMARVDGFLTPDGQFYLNEINTLPGFTQISMYPSLWQASGLDYPQLIDQLIALALERAA